MQSTPSNATIVLAAAAAEQSEGESEPSGTPQFPGLTDEFGSPTQPQTRYSTRERQQVNYRCQNPKDYEDETADEEENEIGEGEQGSDGEEGEDEKQGEEEKEDSVWDGNKKKRKKKIAQSKSKSKKGKGGAHSKPTLLQRFEKFDRDLVAQTIERVTAGTMGQNSEETIQQQT